MEDFADAKVLSSTPNAAVVQLPGRKYPGLVIQGDSLHNLRVLLRDLRTALPPGSESQDVAEEVFVIVSEYLVAYEHTLREHGIALPYKPQEDSER